MKDSPEKMNEQEDDAHSYVLLVEDDEIMRLSLEDRLHLEKISFRTACNIAERPRSAGKWRYRSRCYGYPLAGWLRR